MPADAVPTKCDCRVVKLGGSLLDMDDLAPQLRAWFAAQPSMASLLIVGGGELAEAIRAADRRHGLPQELSHWLCIRAMSMQAEIVATWLNCPLVCKDPRAWLASRRGGLAALDVWPWLRGQTSLPAPELPYSWAATSDSIAAVLACAVKASELVLLKSTLPPPNATAAEASTCGYVDAYFPTASAGVPIVRCVDLRSSPPNERARTIKLATVP